MTKTARIALRLMAALTTGMVLASACDVTESALELTDSIVSMVEAFA